MYPDGKEQLLFDVPRYRFDWQERYVLAEPLKIPTGSLLKYKGVFDNSAENPLNPNPDKEVYWSEQSWDEMSLGWIEYTLDKQRFETIGARVRTVRKVCCATVLLCLACLARRHLP